MVHLQHGLRTPATKIQAKHVPARLQASKLTKSSCHKRLNQYLGAERENLGCRDVALGSASRLESR